MPPPPPEWLRRGLHKHQWAYQLSLVGGPPPGQKQQPEWFPWWKIYTCCMHVDMHKFMCVCVCVCMYICMYVCVCVCMRKTVHSCGSKEPKCLYIPENIHTFPWLCILSQPLNQCLTAVLNKGSHLQPISNLSIPRSVLPVTAKSSRQLYCYSTFDLAHHSYFASRKSRWECLPTPPPLLSFWLHQTLWSIPP